MSCGKCDRWLGWAPQVEPLVALANVDVHYENEVPDAESLMKRAKAWMRHRRVPNNLSEHERASDYFRVACYLVRDFGFSHKEAVDVMEWWSRDKRDLLERIVRSAEVYGPSRDVR